MLSSILVPALAFKLRKTGLSPKKATQSSTATKKDQFSCPGSEKLTRRGSGHWIKWRPLVFPRRPTTAQTYSCLRYSLILCFSPHYSQEDFSYNTTAGTPWQWIYPAVTAKRWSSTTVCMSFVFTVTPLRALDKLHLYVQNLADAALPPIWQQPGSLELVKGGRRANQ